MVCHHLNKDNEKPPHGTWRWSDKCHYFNNEVANGIIEKIMNEFSTNVSTLIQQRRTMMKKNYSLNPLIIRVQFLGLQIAPRKINVENDLAKKKGAPSLEVQLDRIIKVLWQQDASKGMQQYFFIFCLQVWLVHTYILLTEIFFLHRPNKICR